MTRAVPGDVGYWVVDHAAAIVGLLALGLAPGRPGWAAAASGALGVALLQWLFETNGVQIPRLGRTRVVAYPGWAQPLAFSVRRRSRTLLFFRPSDPAGNLAFEYQVFALPVMSDAETRASWSFQPLPEGHLLGTVPLAALRFDYRHATCLMTSGTYVTTSSLRAIESTLRPDCA